MFVWFAVVANRSKLVAFVISTYMNSRGEEFATKATIAAGRSAGALRHVDRCGCGAEFVPDAEDEKYWCHDSRPRGMAA